MHIKIPRFRTIIFALALFFAVSVLFTFASFEITSSPKFCGGTCHNMKPYYNSWSTSSHNQIKCVECHIPPGITSELRKKYEALSMVARYITGTYGTHPWAEVDDANCLTCHERRLVQGKVMFHGITFDHTPHLVEMRRNKKLRCTSCHSQIVQGKHMTVTPTTCFLCHFKDQPLGQNTARCQLCHEVPDKVIDKPGLVFNHADVKRFDMKCDSCHSNIVRGDGEVPQSRCLSCHNETERLQEYSKTEELHKIHVTQHKVECLHCHNEIQHGTAPKTATTPVHAVGDCSTCHGEGHSPQQELYAGMGVNGVLSSPNPMYLAGIRCEGCHVFAQSMKGQTVEVASRISCMECHGAAFARVFERWQSLTQERLSQSKALLSQAKGQFAEPYPEEIRQAEKNIEFVENALPIHNVDYSLSVLDKSVQLMNQSLQSRGKSPVKTPWQMIPFESPCLSCHQGIENQSGDYGGRSFAHYKHIIEQKLECQTCHVQHEIPLKQKPMKFPPSGCADCHHKGQFQTRCVECHAQNISKGVTVQGAVLDRKGLVFNHSIHMETTGLKCVDCHTEKGVFRRTPVESRCVDCHGK